VREEAAQHALERLAGEAAVHLAGLVHAGEEIPFELAEQPGHDSAFVTYAPCTERFIHDHAPELRRLGSWTKARSAIVKAGLAPPYLEQAGIAAPAEPPRQADEMILAFLSRLWADSDGFTLDGDRFENAARELDERTNLPEAVAQLAAPMIGLRMPAARLEMAGCLLVRADTVDVPSDARLGEGTGRAGWEPGFLALLPLRSAEVEVPSGHAHPVLRRVVTAMRLFKPGSVGLGPLAFSRNGGAWRQRPTGARPPRRGAYHLTQAELPQLAELSRRLAGGVNGPLAFAIARFDMGAERESAIDALSDYLLALRALFEAGGPVGAGMAMRIAALCAEPAARPEARATVGRALALERRLMGGAAVDADDESDHSPVGVASEIEDLTRTILCDAVCGRLDADLSGTADRVLVEGALEAGEGLIDPELRGEGFEDEPDEDGAEAINPELGQKAGREIGSRRETVRLVRDAYPRGEERRMGDISDWLSEVDSSESDMEFKVFARDDRDKSRTANGNGNGAERVRHLFPVPETTEWTVKELQYDRRRARGSA
jgi:hypothetical protein